jgi:DNA-binding CsgD family transcriptional regulator
MEQAMSEPLGNLVEVRRQRALACCRGDVEMFERAANQADERGLPIEADETRLALAEHLARDGRGDDARLEAERARVSLGRRGVLAWAGRTERVLEAPGASSGVEDVLTPAEHRVALAVAGGGTNREVAAALYLSVKTVDFHLQNIYRKLGLRSRTELAVRVSGEVVHTEGGPR